MRKFKEMPLFTDISINSAKSEILNKYGCSEHFEMAVNPSNYCLYKVNFLDESFVHVIMTKKERSFFFKNRFSQYVDSIRGEGYQKKRAA